MLLAAATATSAGVWAWALAVALADRRRVPRLEDVKPASDGPLVSVVVPARNEEGRLRPALRSLAGQRYRAVEVIVVDDQSTDGTRAEAQALAGKRVRVVAGAPLPAGWVGKSWANHQGARLARGEWLLFTDADVVHEPDAVGRAVALARRLGRGGLTVLCRVDCESVAERIVQPSAAVFISAFVAPGPLVRSARSRTAFAAGSFILLERPLYDRIGGHEAQRGALVDDVTLAVRVKRAGAPLAVATGRCQAHVRMYHGFGEVWRGWRKNSSAGLADGSLPLAVVSAFQGTAISLAPLAALARGPRILGAVAFALQTAARTAHHPGAPTPRRYWLTMPLGGAFLSAVSLLSSLDRVRGWVEWRGRRYEQI